MTRNYLETQSNCDVDSVMVGTRPLWLGHSVFWSCVVLSIMRRYWSESVKWGPWVKVISHSKTYTNRSNTNTCTLLIYVEILPLWLGHFLWFRKDTRILSDMHKPVLVEFVQVHRHSSYTNKTLFQLPHYFIGSEVCV